MLIVSALLMMLCCQGAAAQGTANESAPASLNALKSAYFRPPPRPVDNPALVALGRELFSDQVISASGKTSCGSCHLPQFGWATNEARSKGDSGRPTSRKSQTLIGMGHAAPPFGWDGRSATLEAQAVSSIGTGSMSMFQTSAPVKVDEIVGRIRASKTYPAKFKAAFPAGTIDLDAVVIALAAFERTIEPDEAPFDRWIAGDERAISDAAKRGFVLFNGKANCSGCHGGWRFTDDRFHDIGTTTTDRGRGRELKDDATMQFAFKTPTLRSVGLRAPYMHDGSVATLRDVVDHYVKGGIDRPSRSPMMHPVELTDEERSDLVAFLEVLTGEQPKAVPERQDKPGETFKECDLCPEMVVVPAGSFTMGSPASEEYRYYTEGPQRRVTIARPFAAGKFAVTFDEWDACVADGGCSGYRPADEGWGRGKRPAINVTWDDAKAYVAWLSQKTGKGYRLLSEAEREYAARAGTTTPFWWGTAISPQQANYNGNYMYGGRTMPVDHFSPNPWGLYQVHGNVWEWTEDCWNGSYADAPTDGSAWTRGDCGRRVIRGGSWYSYPRFLRSANRGSFVTTNRDNSLGFRVARTLLTP